MTNYTKKRDNAMELPMIDGIGPSVITLPKGPWQSVLVFLSEHFAAVGEQQWISRMQRKKVLDGSGTAIDPNTPYKAGTIIFYYRELERENTIPFKEKILYENEHVIVVDKPHFLPVMPSGSYLHETVLTRLRKKYNEASIVPIHRIDKDTAGIVVFSRNPNTRSQYASIFSKRTTRKTYEAIAPVIPGAVFPLVYRSRIVKGEPFFRMKEAEGKPNSETSVNMLQIRGRKALYQLIPATGKKHQLRLHLSSLGIPIENDRLYPRPVYRDERDFSHPLQLVARSISFVDPMTGEKCCFETDRTFDVKAE
ncbi:MAG TPA: pseudouridine synthase [Syntrophorhabdaceae bacterium]|nr:pseudouridine synthase [Syntrophorhabdaceae bacterium]